MINNIGTHLVKITIAVIKKYNDKFKIKKILVTDHSFLKKNISLGDLQILKTGKTFYGNLGFLPYNENEVKNKIMLKNYNKNISIIKNLKVVDSKLIYYLEKFNKKKIIDVSDLIVLANKYDKLSDYIKTISNKDFFDNTCIVLNYIIPKLMEYNKITSFHNQMFILY